MVNVLYGNLFDRPSRSTSRTETYRRSTLTASTIPSHSWSFMCATTCSTFNLRSPQLFAADITEHIISWQC